MSGRRRVLGSAAFYPLTLVWLLGAVLSVAVTWGDLRVTPGLIILAFVALLLMLTACRRELAAVHHLVNSQHDELVERVNQLVDALEKSDVPVPPRPPKG